MHFGKATAKAGLAKGLIQSKLKQAESEKAPKRQAGKVFVPKLSRRAMLRFETLRQTIENLRPAIANL